MKSRIDRYNEIVMAFFGLQAHVLNVGESDRINGVVRINSCSRYSVFRSISCRIFMTFTWSCTKR